MELHPRSRIESIAGLEINEAVSAIFNKYNLTYGELWRILSALSTSWSKYAVREERGNEHADEMPIKKKRK